MRCWNYDSFMHVQMQMEVLKPIRVSHSLQGHFKTEGTDMLKVWD